MLIEQFDEQYVVVIEVVVFVATAAVVAARLHGGDLMQVEEFNNTKPSEFDGTKDLISAMRLIFDVEGCFYTYSYPEDLKVRFALNLFLLGAKHWWRFLTIGYSPAKRATMT